MPQNQIAEIVSDKLIDYIKCQFEEVKKQSHKNKKEIVEYFGSKYLLNKPKHAKECACPALFCPRLA